MKRSKDGHLLLEKEAFLFLRAELRFEGRELELEIALPLAALLEDRVERVECAPREVDAVELCVLQPVGVELELRERRAQVLVLAHEPCDLRAERRALRLRLACRSLH